MPEPETAVTPLLDVRHLHVSIGRGRRPALEVVRDVSFQLGRGEIVGVVGESGSGKSITAMSLLQLLPRNARPTGEAWLDRQNLLDVAGRQLQQIRGGEIGVIYQEPMTALDPVLSIGEQISETIRTHRKVSRQEAKRRAIELLGRVGIPDATQRYGYYPHELSGGMRQRILIAIALSCDPKMLIADEPTTALDVTIQAQILELLQKMSREQDMAVLLISHNLGVIAQICARVIVMYAGQIIEQGPIAEVLAAPAHPYTAGLLAAMPTVKAVDTLPEPIPGRLPSPGSIPPGCRFASRCAFVQPRCRETEQDLLPVGDGRLARCCRVGELQLRGVATNAA